MLHSNGIDVFIVDIQPVAEVSTFLVSGFAEEGKAGAVGGGDVGVERVEMESGREVVEFVEHGKGVALAAVFGCHHDADSSPLVERVVIV